MADQNPTENEQDPGANTQMFRAFVNEAKTEAAEEPRSTAGRWRSSAALSS